MNHRGQQSPLPAPAAGPGGYRFLVRVSATSLRAEYLPPGVGVPGPGTAGYAGPVRQPLGHEVFADGVGLQPEESPEDRRYASKCGEYPRHTLYQLPAGRKISAHPVMGTAHISVGGPQFTSLPAPPAGPTGPGNPPGPPARLRPLPAPAPCGDFAPDRRWISRRRGRSACHRTRS